MIPEAIMDSAVARLRDATANRAAILANIEAEGQGGPRAGDVGDVADLREGIEDSALRVLSEVYYHEDPDAGEDDEVNWPDPHDVKLAIERAEAGWLYRVILSRVLDPGYDRVDESSGGER